MELSALIAVILNFTAIGLLPLCFFRRDGKFTRMWFMTAWPFFAVPVLVILHFSGVVPSLVTPQSTFYPLMMLAGVALSLISVAMIAMTVGTHRVPLALWHQDPNNDRPVQIVTWGTYRFVRHPFYSAFLLAFAAAFLIAPNYAVLACGVYGAWILNYTAGKEEQRLSGENEFGETYRRYCETTGRFWPKRRGSAGATNEKWQH